MKFTTFFAVAVAVITPEERLNQIVHKTDLLDKKMSILQELERIDQ